MALAFCPVTWSQTLFLISRPFLSPVLWLNRERLFWTNNLAKWIKLSPLGLECQRMESWGSELWDRDRPDKDNGTCKSLKRQGMCGCRWHVQCSWRVAWERGNFGWWASFTPQCKASWMKLRSSDFFHLYADVEDF